MSNKVKKIIVDGRNRFFGEIIRSLDRLSHSSKQEHLELQQKQIEIYNALSTQLINKSVIQIADNEILVKIFNGLKIYLDTRDISVAPHIALDGIWEPHITQAWLSLIKPKDTIFDIGANFGYFGLLAAHNTDKKKSKIIFIEANPHLIPYINKTLSLNWYNEQSLVENFAVSDKEGTVTLNVLEDYIGSSSVQTIDQLDSYAGKKMQLKLNEAVKVPAKTIDGYCREKGIKHINLIKMDIEGYEDKAYLGMREMIKASPEVSMFVEFTKDGYSNPKAFYDQMLADFGCVYTIDSDGNLVKPKNMSYETVIGRVDDWVMPVFSKDKSLNVK